jgi:hypothetical protein
VVAVEVPVYRDRQPPVHVLWEGAAGHWPCRLRWSHTPSPDEKVDLAVGLTGGRLLVLSLPLPGPGGGAGQWAEPGKTEVWAEEDGIAVRHVAWQQDNQPVGISQS